MHEHVPEDPADSTPPRSLHGIADLHDVRVPNLDLHTGSAFSASRVLIVQSSLRMLCRYKCHASTSCMHCKTGLLLMFAYVKTPHASGSTQNSHSSSGSTSLITLLLRAVPPLNGFSHAVHAENNFTPPPDLLLLILEKHDASC